MIFSCINNENSFTKDIISEVRISSLKEINIKQLQTDDFNNMIHLNKTQFTYLFNDSTAYSDSTYFIHSIIPNNYHHLLVLYIKNYETDSDRIDYLRLLNINKHEEIVDNIILSVLDNRVIQYEVNSIIKEDTLLVTELQSSEPYFNPDRDTLYTIKTKIHLNSKHCLDTINRIRTAEVRLD